MQFIELNNCTKLIPCSGSKLYLLNINLFSAFLNKFISKKNFHLQKYLDLNRTHFFMYFLYLISYCNDVPKSENFLLIIG